MPLVYSFNCLKVYNLSFTLKKHKQIAPSVHVPGFTFPSRASLCVCVFVGHKSRFHAVSNRSSQKVHSTPCCTTLYNTDQFWRSVSSSSKYGLSVILKKTNYDPYISSSGSTSSLNNKWFSKTKLQKSRHSVNHANASCWRILINLPTALCRLNPNRCHHLLPLIKLSFSLLLPFFYFPVVCLSPFLPALNLRLAVCSFLFPVKPIARPGKSYEALLLWQHLKFVSWS